jgi:hypothetical protein
VIFLFFERLQLSPQAYNLRCQIERKSLRKIKIMRLRGDGKISYLSP